MRLMITACSSDLDRPVADSCPRGRRRERTWLVNRRHQWPLLMGDRNGDQCRTISLKRSRECFLDFLLGFGMNRRATEALGRGDDVESGKVQAGDIRRLFQNSEFLEDGVLSVAWNDEDDLQLLLNRGI